MKTSYSILARLILSTLLITISLCAFSQKITIWTGGTPGHKNDWFCPQNWSTSSVPDEFSNVIIPDVSTSSFALPVIRSGRVEVNSLVIKANATLTIENDAILKVLDDIQGSEQPTYHGEGALVIHEGTSEMMRKIVSGKM